MLPLSDLTIDKFLPLPRMRSVSGPAASQYASAKPFPHVVFDDFFDPQVLDQVIAEFPRPDQIKWQRFNNEREVKLASATEASFGPATRLLLYHLNSITFLEFLSAVTGIPNLIPDPSFDGGGLHQIERGGKLGVHVDFNKHGAFNLDRRLNVLVYLNKDWNEEYGGHLELWEPKATTCEKRVAPLFNRMMVFGTTDFTYHGHPHPLGCPKGTTRKSLALYYFTNGRPANELSGSSHSTVFLDTPGVVAKSAARRRLGTLAHELLPPIVFRALRRGR